MDRYETYDIKQLVEDDASFLVPAQASAEFEEDDDGEKVVKGGIVYKNEFICGCCGGVFSLKSKHCIKRLYVYNDWVDVSDQIAGASADDLKIETE